MNPAVLLIDMQEYFIDGDSPAGKLLIPSQLEVLTYCAETDIPVIVVEYSFQRPQKTINYLLEKCNSVPRHRTIIKDDSSAFDKSIEPNLQAILNYFNIDELVLMGVEASCCVNSTASDALRLGYKISTTGDLIADNIIITEDGKTFLYPESINSYKNRGNFFNTHKDLIKHLEALK